MGLRTATLALLGRFEPNAFASALASARARHMGHSDMFRGCT